EREQQILRPEGLLRRPGDGALALLRQSRRQICPSHGASGSVGRAQRYGRARTDASHPARCISAAATEGCAEANGGGVEHAVQPGMSDTVTAPRPRHATEADERLGFGVIWAFTLSRVAFLLM